MDGRTGIIKEIQREEMPEQSPDHTQIKETVKEIFDPMEGHKVLKTKGP